MLRPYRSILSAILPAALLLAAGPANGQTAKKPNTFSSVPVTTIKGPGQALEGDMLVVAGTTVRLMGIDAPDRGQMCKNRYGHELDCFTISRDVLETLVKGEEVECTLADQNRHRQMMGECRVRGVDLGGAMVARGWAFQFWGLTAAYQKAEAYAQSHKMGLWAGRVEKPWEWRSRRLREQAR